MLRTPVLDLKLKELEWGQLSSGSTSAPTLTAFCPGKSFIISQTLYRAVNLVVHKIELQITHLVKDEHQDTQ
jgi:hypothetical protein